MTLPPIRMKRGLIDQGDLAHVRNLGHKPVLAEPCPLGGNGVINPHVTRFHNADGSKTDVFHIKPIYYEAKDGSWRPMDEVASFHGNKRLVLKMGWGQLMDLRFFQWLMKRQALLGDELLVDGLVLQPRHMMFATDSTFYPDPHTETTTVDGYARSYYRVFATARADTAGEVANSNDSTMYYQGYKDATACFIARLFFLFDTSAITDSDTISSAVIGIYKTSTAQTQNDASAAFEIVTAVPASNTNIVVNDYNIANFGSTSLGAQSLTTMSLNAYFNITLNSVADISKTGVTKLGSMMSTDLSNTVPSNGGNQSDIRTADYAGTTSDPKLVVTHAAGGTNVTVSATIASATLSIPAYTVTAVRNVVVTPSTATATLSTVAPTATGEASVTVNTQTVTASVPPYSIVADGNIIVTVGTKTLVASIPAYTVTTQSTITVTPNTQVVTVGVIAPTVPVGTGVVVSPSTPSVVASIPSATVIASRSIGVVVSPITLSAVTVARFRVGGVWTRSPRATAGGDWTRSAKNYN